MQLKINNIKNYFIPEKQTGERDPRTEECERLKAELAQVKLELRTSLKTEHTHMRELDTLR